MYSVLGFGFAFGGVLIIAEIIVAKFMSQRAGSSLCTILLLLTISSTLTAVTIKMIDRFYDPEFDPCLLENELCEWEYHKENMSLEHLNICEI